MPPPLRLNARLAVLIGLGACLSVPAPGRAAEEDETVVVVSARVSDDYVHDKLPDGSFRIESYTFGQGGRWGGAVKDESVEKLGFMTVARTIAGPLAHQGYVPSSDANATKQLIMVYWGRTTTPGSFNGSVAAQLMQTAAAKAASIKSTNKQATIEANSMIVPPAVAMPCGKFDPDTTVDQVVGLIDSDNALSGALALAAAQNRSRDLMDAKNASLLGYDSWWAATNGFNKGTPFEHRRQDMIDELEHDRYFVILMAYDFQKMWKHRQHKLLWETRFSINERGVDFDKALPLMAMNVSKYFGEDSNGLVHGAMPMGHVEVGPVQSLGVVAAK